MAMSERNNVMSFGLLRNRNCEKELALTSILPVIMLDDVVEAPYRQSLEFTGKQYSILEYTGVNI
jgi:hypothetical protein